MVKNDHIDFSSYWSPGGGSVFGINFLGTIDDVVLPTHKIAHALSTRTVFDVLSRISFSSIRNVFDLPLIPNYSKLFQISPE